MRMSVRAKQVAGVTALVGAVVVVLSALHLSALVRVTLGENQARGELLANAVYHRAHEVVAAGGDPRVTLRSDGGVRAILESAVYSPNVTYAAIADEAGVVVAHTDPMAVGRTLAAQPELQPLLASGPFEQWRALYPDAGMFEVRTPLLIDGRGFGTIRVGVSMLLARHDLARALEPAAYTALAALAVAAIVASILAHSLLRPVHLIRSGLSRLGRGEFGVVLDLPQDDEFGELGAFFNTVSAQVSADRSVLAGQKSTPESLARTSQRVMALGRLTSGVAHELKNPLNAMGIHLELIRQQLDPGANGGRGVDVPAALDHVQMIAASLRRLDEVVQVFLKFTRPDEVQLQPTALDTLLQQVRPIVEAEAGSRGISVEVDCPAELPAIRADAAMMEQAFLNLSLNACQAMPAGGHLRISAGTAPGGYVRVRFEDTGVGIVPEHLDKVFNLYFTTKAGGSGIGLSMVYRAVQLHDGEIEVQSSAGQGTTFQILLPQA
jgi:signal transduction histidine kinase